MSAGFESVQNLHQADGRIVSEEVIQVCSEFADRLKRVEMFDVGDRLVTDEVIVRDN